MKLKCVLKDIRDVVDISTCVREKIGNNLWTSVRDEGLDPVWDQVDDEITRKIWTQLWTQLNET